MSLTAQSGAEFEAQALEKLRDDYTKQGFTFIPHPAGEQIPAFLGSYKPDAIALKPDSKIVIEVKQRTSPGFERSLAEIRRLFDHQSDWQFVVSYGGSDPNAVFIVEPASAAEIRTQLESVRSLATQGHRRAAFVVGWSLLEAALHRLEGEEGKRPRAPGTVVESLAMLGYISPSTERQLRHLIPLRNRIVHGDVRLEPTSEQLGDLFVAVDEAIA